MASRPPGKLIVLPSAQRHWQQQQLRRSRQRRAKVAVAGVGLLGLLLALLDVTMDAGSSPAPVSTQEESSEEVLDEAPHPSAGRTSREPDARPALLTTGSD